MSHGDQASGWVHRAAATDVPRTFLEQLDRLALRAYSDALQILQLLDGKGIVQFYNIDILGCYLSFRQRNLNGFGRQGRVESGAGGVNALAASHGSRDSNGACQIDPVSSNAFFGRYDHRCGAFAYRRAL